MHDANIVVVWFAHSASWMLMDWLNRALALPLRQLMARICSAHVSSAADAGITRRVLALQLHHGPVSFEDRQRRGAVCAWRRVSRCAFCTAYTTVGNACTRVVDKRMGSLYSSHAAYAVERLKTA